MAAQVSKQDLVVNLRLQSRSFQRQSSHFLGVTRHQKGKWEARIGLPESHGKKYQYAAVPWAAAFNRPCYLPPSCVHTAL